MGDNPLETRYKRVKKLQKGAQGTVYRYKCKETGHDYAVKLISTGTMDAIRVKREILACMTLAHPNVIRFREAFWTPSASLASPKALAIVMEYAPGGDLFDYMNTEDRSGGVCEEEAQVLFRQLMLGLQHCHLHRVVNRDIKPENILLSGDPQQGGLLKICDFGLSKIGGLDSLPKTKVGTTQFMAPEVYTCESMNGGTGTTYDAMKADIWSCGMVLYQLLEGLGTGPFGTELQDMFKHIYAGQLMMPRAASAACCELLAAMLQLDPQARPSVDQALQHPWLKQQQEPAVAPDLAAVAPAITPRQTVEQIEALFAEWHRSSPAATADAVGSKGRPGTIIDSDCDDLSDADMDDVDDDC